MLPVSFVKIKCTTKPWITPVLLDLINKRWKAYREKNFSLYNHYKVKVRQEIIKSKKIWSDKMCRSSKGLWSLVGNVRGKNVTKSSSSIISLFPNVSAAAHAINVLFGQFFGKSESFPRLSFDTCDNFVICSDWMVCDLLSKIKSDKAMGSDMLPPILLKRSATEISRPLCHIFNLSFRTGVFPLRWKIADVCPVPKTRPVQLNQLRPISLLPCVSKIFEKIVIGAFHSNLMKYFDSSQYAYRPKSSTVFALITVHDSILRLLDDSSVVGVRVVAFDMTHAFDSVPHHLLLRALSEVVKCVPDGNYLLNWLNDYLCKRKQRVRLGNTRSDVVNVTSGVPQGSILGPFLFAFFMSSYRPKDPGVPIIKYADDVTLIIPVFKSDQSELFRFSSEVDHFQKWCCDHSMQVNAQKTKVMNVCFARTPLASVSLFDNVSALKILGLIFNYKLNWSDHINFISKTVSKRLYILRVLKPYFSHDQLVFVFNQTIRSIMEYASPVFLNPGSNFNIKLLFLCKRAFRIVHGKNVVECTSCNMFDFVDRRFNLSMKFFRNALRDPSHIIHDLLPVVSPRSARLLLPSVRTERRVMGFIFSCSELYNKGQ